MEELKTFRDRDASLWQSAVEAVLARFPAAQQPAAGVAFAPGLPLRDPSNPVLRAAAFSGAIIAHQNSVADPVTFAAGMPVASATDEEDPVQFGLSVVDLARRIRDSEERFRAALQVKFSNADPLWVEAAVDYYRYLNAHREAVPYRAHQDLNDFVLDNRLPAKARVALIADWGTGTSNAFALLQQIAAKQPDLVIHLGDIYYSGQQSEVVDRFLNLCRRAFEDRPIPIFTLAGNHDMYSGGQPYYWLISQLGQPASYFCLRNEHWQFVAMDTGRNTGLTDATATSLQPAEAEWVRDRVANAGGRKSILLSHHQLFSAFEATAGASLNERLYEQLAPVLPQVTWWFWGHEHDLTVYGAHSGLQRGRCIGHRAIPVTIRVSDAFGQKRKKKFEVPVEESVQLAREGLYYDHGYVLVDLDGPLARATYYAQSAPENPLYREGPF
jgi:hypothetical protein